MLHKDITIGERHGVINWEVADSTARSALTVTADDIYKVALQLDNGGVYILLDEIPTWGLLNGNVVPVGGSTGHVLTKISGSDYDVEWAAPAGSSNIIVFSAKPSANTAGTSGSLAKIILGTEDYDSHNLFSSSRFTPNVAGYYHFDGNIGFVSAVTGNGAAYINKNGVSGDFFTGQQINSSTFAMHCSALVYLNGTTDYVELWSYITGASTINSAGYSTYLQGHLVKATV